MITAKIIEDSISEAGVRLTTMQLCYPRFIHAEFMTHRVFSRNASSSRAIPVQKMIDMVRNEPAMPIHWGANQPGMQAKAELEGKALENAKYQWALAANAAADIAQMMEKQGLHKQVANRILEPFQHIHVIVTATEWENFFALRAHPDAQPEIQELAVQMMAAMLKSKPAVLKIGELHLPYVTQNERNDALLIRDDLLVKLSGARCARVSFLLHDGSLPSVTKDLELFERLVGSVPLHASPIEHQATPMNTPSAWSGNFRGWTQHRKLFEAQ